MEVTLDRPAPPRPNLGFPPPTGPVAEPHRTGGRCNCLCHTEEAQRLISVGLFVLGTFMYFAGILAEKTFRSQRIA